MYKEDPEEFLIRLECHVSIPISGSFFLRKKKDARGIRKDLKSLGFVLLKAIPAVHCFSFSGLEWDFAFVLAFRTDRFVHLSWS
jgi:hypothetical protein